MACILLCFLFLLLPFIPQISSDRILSTYVALRETVELPCPAPPTLYGDEVLSWFRSPVSGFPTILVIRVPMADKAPETETTLREVRLSLLRNNSLWLDGAKEEDAGRYWCAVLGKYFNYQNWRVYDLSVIRGFQLSAKTTDGSVCSILVCSVVSAVFLDSVAWLEGKGKVKAAASPDALPAHCVVSPTWDTQKILLLLCVLGQGVTILALGIVLWRRRNHGALYRDDSTSRFKPEIEVYENIHLTIPSTPAPRTM
ncbi:lymphocyte antigen 6 complex locus protein G6f isoform X2 [Vombatus ursinus]|uniref:lymphocyte antigen 6 complex locus protein G6f isoform X2 n=1 Tax=Vombatus ursinus TaxID=29139 RepID=UPI000FFD9E59|nr:lymphocyte antigen 6 complex locus protein G6f isoform X2 [Vombatus ursinus]